MGDELGAIRGAFIRVAQRINFKTHVVDAQLTPNARRHDHDFGVNVRAVEAEAFHVKLVELTVASLLRTLVTEHLAQRVDARWGVVRKVRFNRCSHQSSRQFRPQRELLAVQFVLKRVHLFFNDVGHFADRAHKEGRVLDDGRAHVSVAVLAGDASDGFFEEFPARRFAREDVVHAPDGLELSLLWLFHDVFCCAV